MPDDLLPLLPRLPEWRVVSASIQGVSHERTGTVCQDNNVWTVLPGGIMLAAIGDGAGSASLSDVGSHLAVNTAIAYAATQISEAQAIGQIAFDDSEWNTLLRESLRTARTAIRDKAVEKQVKPRELASTLILIVSTLDEVCVAQVGDGAVVIGAVPASLEGPDDSEHPVFFKILTLPSNGEYANETTFINMVNAVENAQVAIHRGRVTQIAAFSDGLQMVALQLPENAPHAPFFKPLFSFISQPLEPEEAERQLRAFLTSDRMRARADDDLTLLLASLEMSVH